MENMVKLAQEFVAEEGLTMKNALNYSGLGMSKTAGQIAEIVSGVGFADHPYSPDRQRLMAEILGEVMFYWHVLASTLEIAPEEIIAEYIATYENTRVTAAKEKISIVDMMEMRKYVKNAVGAHNEREVERKKDNEEKRKRRESLL